MERQLAEAALDDLFAEHRNEIHAMALTSIEGLIAQLAHPNVLDRTDSDRKPGEMDDEAERRDATLLRVKAAQVVAVLLADLTNDITAREAANAVWLGASLADLGSASGSTRQAARKRWPDLGQIYRMRRWLSGHHEDIVHISDGLAGMRPFMVPKKHVTQDIVNTAYDRLKEAIDQVRADFDSGSMVVQGDTGTTQVIRWQRLGELVDKRVRLVVDLIEPTERDAEWAIERAQGMLAHYDAVNATPSR
jgi:hypothetical protein